jgi:hypothetical protein
MLRLLTTLGRGFKERIGWKRLGIAASLLIIALAITTLVRTLKGVDAGVILTALADTKPHYVALAALCVVGAFCTLTFYDYFALRTIDKKHVPYRIDVGLHQLHHRSQYWRHRLHRGRNSFSDLFRLWPERDRRRQNMLSVRPDLLAR